ncbi:hypothetical protein HAX54_044223 [Datura stramonium]|uniref:Uncharacterized protein n=1 Tax=Datura stramonium TaxID=4076 RepID=A0ABS8SP75_DATST|nr:hypothetical protein [Datura stramonium]
MEFHPRLVVLAENIWEDNGILFPHSSVTPRTLKWLLEGKRTISSRSGVEVTEEVDGSSGVTADSTDHQGSDNPSLPLLLRRQSGPPSGYGSTPSSV